MAISSMSFSDKPFVGDKHGSGFSKISGGPVLDLTKIPSLGVGVSGFFV